MRFAVLFAFALAGVAPAAPPETLPELEELEQKLVAAHAAARASVGCVVVSRSDQYPKPAAPRTYEGQLGGFDPEAFRKADPSPARAELAARLTLSDPQAIPSAGFAGGVVIDPAGLVLTTYGAIEGATKIFVHLPAGGSYADVYAADGRSDLAVLKLLTPPVGLAAVPFADVYLPDGRTGDRPNVAPGKLLFVTTPYTPAGRPGGGLAVVAGVRRPPGSDAQTDAARSYYHYGPTVEFEARTNPGCPGAAALTLDGKLFGLTTTAGGVEGDHGRLLPFDPNLRQVVDVLRRGEEVEYGFLGVGTSNALNDDDGVGVTQLTPRGPAALAGIREQDRITRINGFRSDRFEDVLLNVGSALAGSKITLQVSGNGRTRPVEVTLAKFHRPDTASVAAVRPDPVLGLRVDYGSVLAQGQGFGPFGSPPVPPGVYVREVVPDGPAAAKFKALGEGRWVVTHLDDTPTPTPAAFRAAAKGKASARLTVIDPNDQAGRTRDINIP